MTAHTKQQARRIVQNRLSMMTDKEYEKRSRLVYDNVRILLTRLHKSNGLQAVLLYRAAKQWREVDVSPLEYELTDVRFDDVALDAYAPLPAVKYDAILVPLYGFNNDNYRLGHGSGWYDRFLATQPNARKVGVGLETSRIDFTHDAHDIPMDVIVTEGSIIT